MKCSDLNFDEMPLETVAEITKNAVARLYRIAREEGMNCELHIVGYVDGGDPCCVSLAIVDSHGHTPGVDYNPVMYI